MVTLHGEDGAGVPVPGYRKVTAFISDPASIVTGAALADGSAPADAFVVSDGVTKRAVLSGFMIGALGSATPAVARGALNAIGPIELNAGIATATGSAAGADATAALLALDAAASDAIRIPKGVLRLANPTPGTPVTVTINTSLAFPTNGMIRPAAGVTITLNAPLASPPLRQIFDLSEGGSVVFAPGVQDEAWPEWWDGTARAACLPALKAAETSGAGALRLRKVDYYLGAARWQVTTPYLTISGVRKQRKTLYGATRIVGAGGIGTVIQVGPDTMPTGGFDTFQAGNAVRDLDTARDTLPVIPAPGSELSASCGVKFCFTLRSICERVGTFESTLGFVAKGCVQHMFKECDAQRSTAGTSSAGPDIFWPFTRDDTVNIGAAGGSASIYFEHCNAAGPASLISSGIRLNGAFADTVVNGMELTNIRFPIDINGSKGLTDWQGAPGSNGDVRITDMVADGYGYQGARITNVEAHGNITIAGGDFAPAGRGANAAAYVNNCDGVLSITNNKFQVFPDPTNYGLFVQDCRNTFTSLNQIIGSAKPEAWVNCTGGLSANIINNPATAEVGLEPAITVVNSSRVTFRPASIKGAAGSFPAGIDLVDATSQYNTIDPSGIDPACITGGATNKVQINGAVVTSEGTTNTNRVVGLMN